MKFLETFFTEENKSSMTRLMCFVLLLITGFVVVWGVIYRSVDLGLITILLGYVFGGKHIGKALENQKSKIAQSKYPPE